MRRRDFIILVSSGVAAWPLGALAQESGKIWRMGFIAQGYEPFYDALFEGLRGLGYAEGRNVTVERSDARTPPRIGRVSDRPVSSCYGHLSLRFVSSPLVGIRFLA